MASLRRLFASIAMGAALLLPATAWGANGYPALYLSDNVVNVAPSGYEYNGQDWQFNWDSTNRRYYLNVPAGTASSYPTSGDFQISSKTGDYTNWKKGLYYYSNGSASSYTVTPGVKYSLTAAASTNVSSHWMTISNYNYQKDYTFYVSEDCSEMWIVEYDIYLGDEIVGDTSVANNGPTSNWKFVYDKAHDKFTLTVPAKYVSVGGDIQISTQPTNTTEWRKGYFYVDGKYVNSNTVPASKKLETGVSYSLSRVAPTNTSYYWTSIANFDSNAIYTFEIAGDLSTLTITKSYDPGEIYVAGTVVSALYPRIAAPGNTSVTSDDYDPQAYSSNTCGKFTYDSTNGFYHYTFTAAVDSPTFSFSRSATPEGNYTAWCKGSAFVKKTDSYQDTKLRNDLVYPTTSGDEAARYLTDCVLDSTYTIYTTPDLAYVWVEKGGYEPKRLFVKTTADYGSGYVNGVDPKYASIMPYNYKDERYEYRMTSNVGSPNRFGLFTDPHATDAYRVSCQTMLSNQPLKVNGTKYVLYYGQGGDQQLDTSSSNCRIYVDDDLKYFWVKDYSHSWTNLFLCETPPDAGNADTRKYKEWEPLQFVYDSGTDKYRAYLGQTVAGQSFRFSMYASAPSDNTGSFSDNGGFESGWIRLPSTEMKADDKIKLGGYNGDIEVPALWGAAFVIDLNSKTLTLEGSEHPVLYIAGKFNNIGNALTYTTNGGVTSVAVPSNKVEMDYDKVTGIYSYTGTESLSGNFAIYWDESCTKEYLYSCQYKISSDPLDFNNTKYQIVKDPTMGFQSFGNTAGASSITIYVSLNQGAFNSGNYLWAVDNTAENKPFYVSYGSHTRQNPAPITSNATYGEYGIELGTLNAGTTFEFSKFRNIDSTNDSGAAFFQGLAYFEEGKLELGQPIRYCFRNEGYKPKAPARASGSTYAFLTSPSKTIYSARLVVDTDAQTVTLEGSEHPDLYICGAAVSSNRTDYLWADAQKFRFDREHNWYYITVPRKTSIGEPDLYSSSDAHYFVISTIKGTDQYEPMKGALNINLDGDTKTKPGKRYDITNQGTSASPLVLADTRRLIDNYHRTTTYTYYVSLDENNDFKEMWVQPTLNIIGWLTGGYDYTTQPDAEGSNIHTMSWDPDLNEYYYVTRNNSASVFEISTVADGKDGSARAWYDGMIFYTDKNPGNPGADGVFGNSDDNLGVSNWKNLRTQQLGVMPITEEDHQKVSKDDYVEFDANNNHHYYLYKGNIHHPDGNYRFADHTIETYSPNNLYTIHVNADLSYMWVTVNDVHMPLTADDFIENKQPKPHYFLVGTRTADWRLLPEWELEKVNDTSYSLSGRFMYDGYFAFARVDTYQDYIHHRYTIFSNSNESQQNYKDPMLRAIALKNCGKSGAIRYLTDGSDYKHDTSNSITWNQDPGYSDAAANGVVNAEMMERTVPWRISNLTLTLDGNGDPISAQFAGTADPAVINAHRTFSLCGADINYEQKVDLGGSMGEKDLRTMTSAHHLIGEKGDWSNAWISYDPEGKPYYDAYGNTLYLTAYDRDWIDPHDVYFDMPVQTVNGTEFLIYNSENLFFTRSEELQDLENDPYRWLYTKHGLAAAGLEIGSTTPITYSDGDHDYKFYEKLRTNYSDSPADYTDDKPQYAPFNLAAEETYKGWQCYVIRDVWLKGSFKVWTGWGGNVRAYEGWIDNPSQAIAGEGYENAKAHRWFYGDLGHDRADHSFPVEGQEVFILDGTPSPQNEVTMYRTYRHVNSAYFLPEGSNAVEDVDSNNDDATPQFYNRIVLWYNLDEGHKYPGENNGVLLFVQEGASPWAQVFRQTGSPNKLRCEFSIHDNSGAHSDWELVEYKVVRYTYANDGYGNEVEVVSNAFNTIRFPAGYTTEADLSENPISFNDPYALPSGPYFYRVTITARDPETGELASKTAATNTVVISDANKPIVANAKQQMDGNLYTFNVDLTTGLPANTAALDQTSHYDCLVFEDSRTLTITVDAATAATLNSASKIEFVIPQDDHKFLHYGDYSLRPNINWEASGPMGFIKINDTTFASQAEYEGKTQADWNNILQFKPLGDGSGNYAITFYLSHVYTHKSGDKYRYFPDSKTMKALLAFPRIIWHNVAPTYGLATNGDEYKFTVELKPDAKYQDTWTNTLKLEAATTATHVYAPSTSINISGAHLVPSNATVNHSGITAYHKMPAGALHNGEVAYPVQYPNINRIEADAVIATVPVSNEVTENWDLKLQLAFDGTPLDEEETGSNSKPVNGTFRSLPVTTVATTTVGNSKYHTAPRYAYYRPTVAVHYDHKTINKEFFTEPVTSTSRAVITLPTPTYEPAVVHYQTYSRKTGNGDELKWYARCGVNFQVQTDDALDELGLYYYPGFHIEAPVANPQFYDPGRAGAGGLPISSELSTYWYTTNKLSNASILTNGFSELAEGETYDNATHNWSYLARTQGYLGVQIEPLVEVDTEDEAKAAINDITLWADLYTIYPVANIGVTFEPKNSPASAPRKAPGVTPVIDFDNIAPVGVKATVPVMALEGSNVSTGVESIATGYETEGDYIYYNLQGIRVAQPEPGQVYIRTNGTSAEKVAFK